MGTGKILYTVHDISKTIYDVANKLSFDDDVVKSALPYKFSLINFAL
jgi:hypothetical protein